jgi:hypothetical protein
MPAALLAAGCDRSHLQQDLHFNSLFRSELSGVWHFWRVGHRTILRGYEASVLEEEGVRLDTIDVAREKNGDIPRLRRYRLGTGLLAPLLQVATPRDNLSPRRVSTPSDDPSCTLRVIRANYRRIFLLQNLLPEPRRRNLSL